MKNNKILFIIILIILLLTVTSGIYFTIKSPEKTLNQPTQIAITEISNTTQQISATNSTSPFDPSLPHISSTTNIIEMFGITKDTKATITRDVVLEWGNGEKTKSILTIPPNDNSNYGEINFRDYFIYFKEFNTLTHREYSEDEPMRQCLIFARNNNTNKSLIVNKERYLAYDHWDFCSNPMFIVKDFLVIEKNGVEGSYYNFYDSNLDYAFSNSFSSYYYNKKSISGTQTDLSNMIFADSRGGYYVGNGYGIRRISKLSTPQKDEYGSEMFYAEKVIYESDWEGSASHVVINSYKNGKLYFQNTKYRTYEEVKNGSRYLNVDEGVVLSVDKYYYDEAADKVVKIK